MVKKIISLCLCPRTYQNLNMLFKPLWVFQYNLFRVLLLFSISCNSIEKNEKLDSDKRIKLTAKEIYKNNHYCPKKI